jgi:predicted MPP superfamily phosphohydrolase
MSVVEAPPGNARRLLSRRNFLLTGAAAVAAVPVYSNDFARHELEITRPTFYINDLPSNFHGFRIAQISDLHLEEYTEDYFLKRVIHQVNELDPDLVLVTGDFISRGPLPISTSFSAAGRCGELLRGIRCPNRFGILGNHDVAVGARVIRGHMEANGLPILVNQWAKVVRGEQHIFLAGLDDCFEGKPDLDLAIPSNPDAPVILMAHEPDYSLVVAAHDRGPLVDFILSGHTHGGQIRIPGLDPLALPPMGQIYPEGHYLVGDSQLYVNRGVGTVGVPFRLNCPPELTLATLRPMPISPALT